MMGSSLSARATRYASDSVTPCTLPEEIRPRSTRRGRVAHLASAAGHVRTSRVLFMPGSSEMTTCGMGSTASSANGLPW